MQHTWRLISAPSIIFIISLQLCTIQSAGQTVQLLDVDIIDGSGAPEHSGNDSLQDLQPLMLSGETLGPLLYGETAFTHYTDSLDTLPEGSGTPDYVSAVVATDTMTTSTTHEAKFEESVEVPLLDVGGFQLDHYCGTIDIPYGKCGPDKLLVIHDATYGPDNFPGNLICRGSGSVHCNRDVTGPISAMCFRKQACTQPLMFGMVCPTDQGDYTALVTRVLYSCESPNLFVGPLGATGFPIELRTDTIPNGFLWSESYPLGYKEQDIEVAIVGKANEIILITIIDLDVADNPQPLATESQDYLQISTSPLLTPVNRFRRITNEEILFKGANTPNIRSVISQNPVASVVFRTSTAESFRRGVLLEFSAFVPPHNYIDCYAEPVDDGSNMAMLADQLWGLDACIDACASNGYSYAMTTLNPDKSQTCRCRMSLDAMVPHESRSCSFCKLETFTVRSSSENYDLCGHGTISVAVYATESVSTPLPLSTQEDLSTEQANLTIDSAVPEDMSTAPVLPGMVTTPDATAFVKEGSTTSRDGAVGGDQSELGNGSATDEAEDTPAWVWAIIAAVLSLLLLLLCVCFLVLRKRKQQTGSFVTMRGGGGSTGAKKKTLRDSGISDPKVKYSDAAAFGEVKEMRESRYFNISMDSLNLKGESSPEAEPDTPDVASTDADNQDGTAPATSSFANSKTTIA